jgi:hypothetical protein
MKQILLGRSPNHMKQRLSKVVTALLLTSCFALLPIAAQAGNPHGSPTPTPTPTPTLSPTITPSPTPSGEDRGSGNSAAESVDALNINTTGLSNTAHGWHALSANTAGGENTANGFKTLFNNTTGSYNTADGVQALENNTEGIHNTATGWQSLLSNTTGNVNTANGAIALSSNTTGTFNTAMGGGALSSNTTGNYNTATGGFALTSNVTGDANTASGLNALYSNTIGVQNTAIGAAALYENTTGNYNTAVGVQALEHNSTGSGNIALGLNAGSGVTTANNVIAIGIAGQDVSNSCYIGRIFGATSSGGTAVFVNADGRLGTATSSKRFKEDIKPMNNTSEALFALQPVTFRYKKEIDPRGIPQFGLIAEDVAEVNPQLVVRDKEGKVNTVRYEQINAMLLNEFLKEHKKVEEQQVTISDLKKDLGILTAQLKEQAEGIQKVSAQIEMRRPLTRVARSYP